LISVEGVSVTYAGREVIKDVSFDVRPRESFVLFGGSGCGKSILLRVIAGLESPTRGRVKVLGEDIDRLTGIAWTRIQKRIGTALPGGGLLKGLSILENVALPLREVAHLKQADAIRKARSELEALGLADCADLRPEQLSRGERQMVGLARSVVLDPEILLCDDAFAGLDWPGRSNLMEKLNILREERQVTVLITTALPEIGLRAADRMAIMSAGRCIAVGSLEELAALDLPELRQAYTEHLTAMRSFRRAGKRGEPR
jgi:ABC-type transporter Mla maintaining outer membrane lipid asymmetry ATPase subunit MlaF